MMADVLKIAVIFGVGLGCLTWAIVLFIASCWKLSMDGVPCGWEWPWVNEVRAPALTERWARFEGKRESLGYSYSFAVVARRGGFDGGAFTVEWKNLTDLPGSYRSISIDSVRTYASGVDQENQEPKIPAVKFGDVPAISFARF